MMSSMQTTIKRYLSSIGRRGGKATGKRKARTAAQCRAAQRASVAARKDNKKAAEKKL